MARLPLVRVSVRMASQIVSEISLCEGPFVLLFPRA